jgi:hypothetical protein
MNNYQTVKELADSTIKGNLLGKLANLSAGADEQAVITFTGALVDGDNFSIGTRKYWPKLMAAAALTLGDAKLNNTSTGKILGVTINAHGLTPGQIFGVGTEFFRVLNVKDANTVDVFRGYAGSTVAAHASGAAVLQAPNYTNVSARDLVIPVTALAIATSGPQLATALTDLDGFNPNDFGNISSGTQARGVKTGIKYEYIATGTRLFMHRAAQGNSLAITENITNATADTTFKNGSMVASAVQAAVTRVPTAGEVTAGIMDFAFPFPVKTARVTIVTTTTGAKLAWDGATSYSADFRRVSIDNSGAVDWATTHTVLLEVVG